MTDRRVLVPRDRVPRWLQNFTDRHGETRFSLAADQIRADATDGAVATIVTNVGRLAPGDQPSALLSQLRSDLTVGVILARKGGHAVGVFAGDLLLAHANGSGYVQGRTKAGGWSQQRYARRRDNQAHRAYAKAGDDAARILLEHDLDALVCAGDKAAITAILADPRLAPLAALWDHQVRPVAEPRLKVLVEFGRTLTGVTITVNEQARQ